MQLLAGYTRHDTEDAFAEIVRRHLNLVYSAALRQTRSPQLAEEVVQSVFLKLAREAARLAPETILAAWLYQVTRHQAIDVVRREARRRLREQFATEMNALHTGSADWTPLEPLLDEAMAALDETDRTAVLLRYFENKSLREVGSTLGTTDDAAQKRVSRAVERLRSFFAQRGVTVTVSGLAVVLSTHAVQAAPPGLALVIASTAHLSSLTSTPLAAKAIVMTTLKKTLLAATAVLMCGTATVIVTQKLAAPVPAKPAVAVKLDDFVGRFEMTGHRLDLQKKDPGIQVFIDGQPAFVAYAEAANKFVSHDHNSISEMTFDRDATGRTTGLTLVRDGKTLGELKRSEP